MTKRRPPRRDTSAHAREPFRRRRVHATGAVILRCSTVAGLPQIPRRSGYVALQRGGGQRANRGTRFSRAQSGNPPLLATPHGAAHGRHLSERKLAIDILKMRT
jgi:hypothetical protein